MTMLNKRLDKQPGACNRNTTQKKETQIGKVKEPTNLIWLFGYGRTHYIDCAHINQEFHLPVQPTASQQTAWGWILSAITFKCSVFINFMLQLHWAWAFSLNIFTIWNHIAWNWFSFCFIQDELIDAKLSYISVSVDSLHFCMKMIFHQNRETIIEFRDEATLINCFRNLIYMTFDPHITSIINCCRAQCLCL